MIRERIEWCILKETANRIRSDGPVILQCLHPTGRVIFSSVSADAPVLSDYRTDTRSQCIYRLQERGVYKGGGGGDNRGSCSILWEGRHTYTHFHTVPRLHFFVPIAPNFLLALCLLEDEAHWESPNSKATRRVLEGIRVQSADLGPVAIERKKSKGVFIEELGA
jgi:hypothetical protein